jgi:serine protease
VIPAYPSVPHRARRFRAPRLRFAAALPFALLAISFSAPVALAGLNVMPLETAFPWRAPGYVPDELLVKFKDGVSRAKAVSALRSKGATLKRALTTDGLTQVQLPPGTTVDAELDSLGALPDVEYAAPNAYAAAFFTPNDPLFTQFDLTWNLRDVGATGAWDVVTGDPSIVLAIIDSGVAFEDHPIPDYERANVAPASAIYRQSPELPGPFRPGFDFVNNDDHPNDDDGHGTFVATIAAGQANNHVGAAGIAFGVTILPIKVLTFDGGGQMSSIVQGIRYAADQGANVANLSLGFPPMSQLLDFGFTKKFLKDFFHPLKDAIQYAQSRGVILVAAAGNFSVPELSLPAGYPGVISVAATGVDDKIASYSSGGPGLSFSAPGGDFTEINGDHIQDAVADVSIKPFRSEGSLCRPDSFNTFFFFGTSGAAPHVSGAVALLMSQGIRSQGLIEETLRSTAVNPWGRASNGIDPIYGAGIIQVDRAVQLAVSRGFGGKLALGSVSPLGTARLLSENPSRGSAALSLRMSRPGTMRVQLYDVSGRLVRTLDQGSYPAGERVVRWDGKDDRGQRVGSGVYFFHAETPDGVENRRVAILR